MPAPTTTAFMPATVVTVRVTGLGHASVLIETAHGTIVTDPWVNPAYYASWFPFPDNSGLDWDAIGQSDYLFVSHLHRDHLDPDNLRRHFRRDITVLLPAFPTTELYDALRDVGFTSFIETVSEDVVDVDGLQIMVQSLISPTDGPIGDSSLWVYDGEHRLFNQNDARPSDLELIKELGPVDAYLLQFSGAIWYPMVYDLPERAKHALGVSKRERQLDRSLRYIDEMDARFVFPTAGPPCFLDPELFELNDIHGDESNIFPDQTVYLDWLAERGHDEARLLLPGTVADLHDGSVAHPVDPATIFADKTAYLRAYQERQRPVIEAARAGWAHPEIDVAAELKAWIEPLLAEADYMAAGIAGGVRLVGADPVRGDVDLIIDFVTREVRPYNGEKVRYVWRTGRALLEQQVVDHQVDWSNSLFLSCRFSATRIGPYNEFVYTFFKCLSEERINYVEGWYVESDAATAAETTVLDGWEVQRRCPHLKADLSRFGQVDDGVLTCQMHGWKWRLSDGKCLTSVGHNIRASRLEDAAQ
jgi:UDP-MurNAc hydroxylase